MGVLIVLNYRPDRLIVGRGNGSCGGIFVTGVISVEGVLMVLSYRPDRYIVGGRGKVVHGIFLVPGLVFARMPMGGQFLSESSSRASKNKEREQNQGKVHPRLNQTEVFRGDTIFGRRGMGGVVCYSEGESHPLCLQVYDVRNLFINSLKVHLWSHRRMFLPYWGKYRMHVRQFRCPQQTCDSGLGSHCQNTSKISLSLPGQW